MHLAIGDLSLVLHLYLSLNNTELSNKKIVKKEIQLNTF